METLSQSSRLECQICLNSFTHRRRPKLLHCQHTCCSLCLSQMRLSQKEIRCPWCRCVTLLPSGLSVSYLPDDPEVLSIIGLSHSSEHTPIFIHLPNNDCYLLPVPLDADGALLPGDAPCPFAPKRILNVSVARSLVLGDDQGDEDMEEVSVKTSAWTGICTVLLVAFILFFLLGIVLHNMSCVSKRFTIISCG